MDVYTVLRIIAVALGALLIGATVSVIRVHARALRVAPSGSGILSWHVIAVSTGTLLLAGSGLSGVLATLGGLQLPLPLRFGLYIGGTTLILVSLLIIMRGQYVRIAGAGQGTTPPRAR